MDSRKKSLNSWQKIKLFASITYLYFLQGIPYGFQVKYLPLILRKQGHQLDIISFMNLVSLPWVLKFTWAGLFDVYGGSGKIWISGCLCLMSLTSGLLHNATGEYWVLLLVLLLLSFLSASLDIAVDALAIRHFEASDLGYCNIGHIVGYKIGILFGGGTLLILHQDIGLKSFTFGLSIVYALSAIMIIFISSTLYDENEKSQKETRNGSKDQKQHVDTPDKWFLIRSLFTPGQLWLIAFILMYKVGEQGFVSMYPLFLIDKELSLKHIGAVTGLFGQLFSMAGSTVAGLFISKFGLCIQELLFKTSCLRFIVMITYSSYLMKQTLGFFPHAIIDCSFQLLTGMMTTLTFTVMMQTSKMLPSNIHAVHFTLLSAFEVLGKLAMKSFSGSLANNVGFFNFFLICCCLDGFVVLLTFIKCKSKFLEGKIGFVKKLE